MCTPPAVGVLKGPRAAGPPAALPAAPSCAGRPRPPARRRGAMAAALPPRGRPGATVGARGAASAWIPPPLERGPAEAGGEERAPPARAGREPSAGPGLPPRRRQRVVLTGPRKARPLGAAWDGCRARGEEGAVRPLESGSCRSVPRTKRPSVPDAVEGPAAGQDRLLAVCKGGGSTRCAEAQLDQLRRSGFGKIAPYRVEASLLLQKSRRCSGCQAVLWAEAACSAAMPGL